MNKKTIFSLTLATALALSPTLALAEESRPAVSDRVQSVRLGGQMDETPTTDLKTMRGTIRPELEQKMDTVLRDRVRQLGQMFELRLEWLENIVARLEAHIARLETRGVNVSEAKTNLAGAKTKLASLNKQLPEIMEQLASALTSAQPLTSFRKLRETVVRFSEAIRSVHEDLVKITGLLKNTI